MVAAPQQLEADEDLQEVLLLLLQQLPQRLTVLQQLQADEDLQEVLIWKQSLMMLLLLPVLESPLGQWHLPRLVGRGPLGVVAVPAGLAVAVQTALVPKRSDPKIDQ